MVRKKFPSWLIGVSVAAILISVILLAVSAVILYDKSNPVPNPNPPPAPMPPPPKMPPPPVPNPPPVAPPPPPASGSLVYGSQVLKNNEFLSGETSWSTFAGDSQVSNGIMKLVRVSGTINHFGQTVEPVGSGQKLVIKAKVRAGPQVASAYNNGCGFGLDFREYKTGRFALIGTLNGPATTSQQWTIITQEFTIPTRNRADAPLASSSYSVKVESTGATISSTTGGGSRWGRSSNSDNGLNDPTNLPLYYQSHDYPALMNMIEWNHNWHNTMAYCEYDWVTLQIT